MIAEYRNTEATLCYNSDYNYNKKVVIFCSYYVQKCKNIYLYK